MLSLVVAVAPLAFDVRSAAMGAATARAPAVSLALKSEPTVTSLPAGVKGKVVPTKGAPTVSTALLKASGLDEMKQVAALEDIYEAAGATVVAQAGETLVEGVIGVTPVGDITEADVVKAQTTWANAIKSISKVCLEGGDYVSAAAYCAGELYGYGQSKVLFKPTKAAEFPFRPTASEAMSYFVGGSEVDGGYDEDGGFAINGGKGWSDVVFTNHDIELNGDMAVAMGSYVFTCATTGSTATVEYTFGYKKNADGKMRIFLHHSSVPYAVANPITEEEVLTAQSAWAGAITFISKVYAEGGDYVATAAAAAGELYGYGHHNVLFKPTKATAHPFRPTGEVAMSYFVGADAMGMPEFAGEDAGFAINGGKGWKNVVFTNHQIDLNGEVAVAMGSYVFTDATTNEEVTVEYTFGYKRCEDGKPRIFLHHSSVPYSVPKPTVLAEKI